MRTRKPTPMHKYSRIYRAMCSIPWMIQPEKLEAIAEFMMVQMEGHKFDATEIEARTGRSAARPSVQAQNAQNIAVIPVYGVIAHRVSTMSSISGGGGFSIESFRQQFRQALADPSVSTIVLDVDSPGGTVDGVEELSNEIYKARKQKKIIAVSNTLMASAAYYIGSAASELVVTPSGEVGSIGVYLMHQDMSEAYAQQGVKNTLIKAGKFKAEGNPYNPLDEEALSALQSSVDGYYEMFVKAVARNRGVNIDAVRGGFGEGRTVMAKQAVKLGMADRVATLDEVLDGLVPKGGTQQRTSMHATGGPVNVSVNYLVGEKGLVSSIKSEFLEALQRGGPLKAQGKQGDSDPEPDTEPVTESPAEDLETPVFNVELERMKLDLLSQ